MTTKRPRPKDELQIYSTQLLQRRGRIAWAQQLARMLLHECRVKARDDLQLQRFIDHLRIEVRFAPLEGADAQLVRYKDAGIIYVSERLSDIVAIRFAIAHELGHFVLRHPGPTIPDLTSRGRKRTQYSFEHEAEANAFASELLMPRSLLRDLSRMTPVDLDVPRRIAHDYQVSILASAIRLTELSSEPCGAAFVANGKVKWFAKSQSLTWPIHETRLLRPGSLACRYFVDGSLDDRPQRVPADAWFDMPSASEVVEHAICSPKHRTVLSMLWVPDKPT